MPVAIAVNAVAGSVDNVDSLLIGNTNEATGFVFNGIVGDVQLVSGAMSAEEIASLAGTYKRSGLRPYYSSGAVRAWYNWESAGFDKSGNSNHLTKVNDPIIVKVKQ
jgi:hypothetical protein